MKNILTFIILIIPILSFAERNGNRTPKKCDEAIRFSYRLPAEEWVFMEGEKQFIELELANTSAFKENVTISFVLKTDKQMLVDSIVHTVVLKSKKKENVLLDFQLPAPGFYCCSLLLENKENTSQVETFTIGYEPEKIVYTVDSKPDFDTFWEQTRAELNKVEPDFRTTLLPEYSVGAKNIYHVAMMSFGNTKIEGYYAVPKESGVFPAIVVYMGYGSEPYLPHTDGNPGFAEFILSVRGQGIQKAENSYNDKWIISGLESKENYYYRGAYMDLIRAVDFLVSRPEVDNRRIVAEGGSQGGAFTLAACALDDRILAAAPTIPFLSDFSNYFEIVDWPRNDFEYYLKEHPESSWEHIYDVLSYFDIKNLAGKIKCPVVMGVGLQDKVCPPHTNFAGYNQIVSEKEYRIYHDYAHSTPEEWYRFRTDFFQKITK